MKAHTKFAVLLVMACLLLSGCCGTNTPDNDAQTNDAATNNDMTQNSYNLIDQSVIVVTNESEFVQSDALGTELWFNKWSFQKLSSGEIVGYPLDEGYFTIEGKVYDTGLGSDGLTIEGFDKRGFSYIEYVVQSGGFTEISGVFGFDDTTEIRPDSKLIIYADGSSIYESEYINEDQNSIEIHAPISSDTKKIAFRFETSIEQDTIPKIVFAQIEAHRVGDQ